MQLRWGLLGVLFALAAGCSSKPRASIEGTCLFNDDCADGLICAGQFCRAQCATDRDCSNGGHCVNGQSDKAICVAPTSPPLCHHNSDCTVTGTVCSSGLCVPECNADIDCRAIADGAVCTDHVCTVPALGMLGGVPSATDAGPGDATPGDTGVTDARPDARPDATPDVTTDTGPRDASEAGSGPEGGAACAATLCGDLCVDTQTSATNCGTCGHICPDTQTCTGGTCGCPTGRMLCGTTCVDLQTDNANCGVCAMACPTGQGCASGTCGCSASGLSTCGTTCVNEQTDAAHCGSCGHACAGNQVCAAGQCGCPTGQMLCGTTCVNLQTDSAHCGTCGTSCPTGQVCGGGTCGCSASGLTTCGALCVNELTDSAHCGNCNTACTGGQTCTGGVCGCPTGQMLCGTTCVNLQTDNAHCGACATTCATAAGQACTNAACACSASGLTACGALCVAEQTDTAHCGTCTTVCATGQTCTTGACVCPSGQVLCGTGAAAHCVDTQTDSANCGMCTNACTSAQVCRTGSCTAATFVNILSGNAQTGTVGTLLATPVQIQIVNGAGTGIANAPFTIVPQAGASAIPSSGTANGTGNFPITLRLGRTVGAYSFGVMGPNGSAATVTATATATASGTVNTIVNTEYSPMYANVPGPGALARLTHPSALATASDGTLYIASSSDYRVFALSPAGQLTLVAGNGSGGNANDGGQAGSSMTTLNSPNGLALDDVNHLLYVSSYDRVRVINLVSGTIDTVAGGGSAPSPLYGDNSAARSASLSSPGWIGLGPDGYLYIADNGHNRVRRVNLTSGLITSALTLTGCGTGSGLIDCGNSNYGCAGAWDSTGALYVTGRGYFGGSCTYFPGIVRVNSGQQTLVAGGGTSTTAENVLATTVALSAANTGVRLAFDRGNNLYIATTEGRIRVIDGTGRVHTVSGSIANGSSGDGELAASALYHTPADIDFDASGNLFVADSGNGAVREIATIGSTTTGTVTITATGGDMQTGLVIDSLPPTLLTARVTDNLGAVLKNAPVTWTAAEPGSVLYNTTTMTGQTGFASVRAQPGLAVGTYHFTASVTDLFGHVSSVTFTMTTVAPASGTIFTPVNIDRSPASVLPTGVPGPGTVAHVTNPGGIAVASDRTVYFSTSDNRVFALTPAGALSVLAGTGTNGNTGDGDLATLATISTNTNSSYNQGTLALDDTNHQLYVSSYDRIRVIDLTDGTISTFAGGGSAGAPNYGDGGPPTSASFSGLGWIGLGPDHYLYVADNGHSRIRRVRPDGTVIELWLAGSNNCSASTPGFYDCYQNNCAMAWDASNVPYVTGRISGPGITCYSTAVLRGTPGAFTLYAGGGASTAEGAAATLTDLGSINTVILLGTDPTGRLVIIQPSAQKIRVVNAAGNINTIVGTGSVGVSGDYGLATAAQIYGPRSVSSSNGHLYFTDLGNNSVRVVW